MIRNIPPLIENIFYIFYCSINCYAENGIRNWCSIIFTENDVFYWFIVMNLVPSSKGYIYNIGPISENIWITSNVV